MCNEKVANDSVQEQIRLDQDVYEDLIEMYIRKNMIPESLQVFNDYILSGSSLEDAATKAMVNEMANIALAFVIDEITRAEKLIETGNAILSRYKDNPDEISAEEVADAEKMIETGEAILSRYSCYKKNKNKKEDNTDDNSTEEVSR